MPKSQGLLRKFVCLSIVVGFLLIRSVGHSQTVSQSEATQPLAGLTILCDLDYTILDHDSLEEAARSQHRSWLMQKLRNVFVPPTPVPGMVEVLRFLKVQGATIQFVSARKHSQFDFLRKTLNDLQFQDARLQLAEYIPHGGESMYKYEHIGAIIRYHPEQRFFLIGDNQDRDPKVFDRLVSEAATGEKIIGTFIRNVRQQSSNVPRRKDLFSDGFHLAEIFTQIGLISSEQFESILKPGSSRLCRSLFAN